MEKYKIRYILEAIDDLDEILLYIAKDSVENALKMYDEIRKNINKLDTFPKRGRLVPDKNMARLGIRMLFISSYIVFYRIIGEEVFIYRIIHGKQNYPMLFKIE